MIIQKISKPTLLLLNSQFCISVNIESVLFILLMSLSLNYKLCTRQIPGYKLKGLRRCQIYTSELTDHI